MNKVWDNLSIDTLISDQKNIYLGIIKPKHSSAYNIKIPTMQEEGV